MVDGMDKNSARSSEKPDNARSSLSPPFPWLPLALPQLSPLDRDPWVGAVNAGGLSVGPIASGAGLEGTLLARAVRPHTVPPGALTTPDRPAAPCSD